MHTIEGIRLISDQEIMIRGMKVNVYDITTIVINSQGLIINAYVKPVKKSEGWLFRRRD